MSSLLNKSNVRKYTESVIVEKRPALKDKMTRVSAEYYLKVENATRQFIQNYIESMPSTGKTVR